MDQGQCPVGHQTKPGPNPILHRLQQLAVVCSTKKESIHFSVFTPMPQPNSLLLRRSCGEVLNTFSKSKKNVLLWFLEMRVCITVCMIFHNGRLSISV